MNRPSKDLTDVSRNLAESNDPPSNGDEMEIDPTSSLEDEEMQEGVHAPPPRIAARFYRPSQIRRRGSAASSRRNSVSSAHSRCSSVHRGNTGSPGQSKHAAQHLRRASFLEDRRARLADRAAHAEKVRLRAALAKVPKGTSSSEERALAAQLARERNLAGIVASCAEEVKKAKHVAEQTKEKREQETARLKQQMDERMAEAEKRREELRSKTSSRRNRGHSVATAKSDEVSVPAVEDKKPRRGLTDKEAVGRLQSWWRMRSRQRTLDAFQRLGLTVDGIGDRSFSEVTDMLNQESVVQSTAHLLRMCGLRREDDPGSVDEGTAARMFLSAFLILGHPAQVLSNKSDEEAEAGAGPLDSFRLPARDLENPPLKDLIGKAKTLLVVFEEKLLPALTRENRFTAPAEMKHTFSESYAAFCTAFLAWKSEDSSALVEVMLMQFVELDTILQSVKDETDDAVSEVYRQSIRDNQLLLMVRIKRLVGQEAGKKMIFKAVIDSRRKTAKSKKASGGDTKPRVTENASADEAAALQVSQTATPPPTPARKSEAPELDARMGLLHSHLPADNRPIAHEVAINKEYVIPVEEYKARTAASMKPVYALARQAFQSDDGETKLMLFANMIEMIKTRLQKLLREGKPMYNMVEEMLDPAIMRNSFALGTFSYEKFFRDMAVIIPQLCAPARDEEAQELFTVKFKTDDVIDRFMALNEFIDTMTCDYVNHLFRMVAPQLIDSSPEYEARRFDQDLSEGKHTLEHAERAWRSARARLLLEAQKRDVENVNHAKSRPTASRIYAQMLVDLVTQPQSIYPGQVPEMLEMDARRLSLLAVKIQYVVIAGAIMLQCKNILKRNVRTQWKAEAARILAILSTSHPSLAVMEEAIMSALEAGRSMPAVSKANIRALTRKIILAGQAMRTELTEPTEPVIRLLLNRVRGVIMARLAPASASERAKATTMLSEKLASLGLPEFADSVKEVCDVLEKIGAVDRAAHSPWWDVVAAKVVEDECK